MDRYQFSYPWCSAATAPLICILTGIKSQLPFLLVLGGEGSSARKLDNCPDDTDLGISNEKDAASLIDSNGTSFSVGEGRPNGEESASGKNAEKSEIFRMEIERPDRGELEDNKVLQQQSSSETTSRKKKKKKAIKGTGNHVQTVSSKNEDMKEALRLGATLSEGI